MSRPTREQVDEALAFAETGTWTGASIEQVLAHLAAEVHALRAELVQSAAARLAESRAALAEHEHVVYGVRWPDGREHAHEYAAAVALVHNYPGRCVMVQAERGPWRQVPS